MFVSVCLCIYCCVSVRRSGRVTRDAGAKVTPLRTLRCWRRVCAVRSTKLRTSRKWKSCTRETAKNHTKSTASLHVKVPNTQSNLSPLKLWIEALNHTFSTLLFCLLSHSIAITFIYLDLPSRFNHFPSCWTPSVLSFQAFPLKFSPKSSFGMVWPFQCRMKICLQLARFITVTGDFLYAVCVTRYAYRQCFHCLFL